MKTQTEEASKVHQGHNIRMVRTWNKMSQVALADMLDCSQDRVSKLERQQTIDDEILEKVALALNVDMDYLKEDHSPLGATNNTINDSPIGHSQTQTGAEYSKDVQNTIQGEQINYTTNDDDDLISLYERLLKSEVENAQLKSQVKELKSQLKK
ncbi:transcriptional regulator with XRE-family HTH domain [Dysgonomonas alginatilytica]|uniref:Transcriptional regulator with XRE-family HTH domain n=1 Tax=Dysgonomonas alginatilytica TaxID=1605892 RepID=A0A2V3PT01_9BACT|nr:helix-turn-helix transcriptional regulator [Dysgonomonas alginatilytica]PXV62219.1 transcriptional regulator with XRE-family HTH domain [Dysgonomonas alginatilytica]